MREVTVSGGFRIREEVRTLSRARRVLADLVGGYLLWIPGRIGSSLRVFYYRARGAKIGSGVRIDPGASIDRPEFVVIGDGSWIDRFVIIIAGLPRPGRETRLQGPPGDEAVGWVRIGRRCHIAPYTVLSGIGGLEIGDDSGLAAGCRIYSLSHHYRSWRDPSDTSISFTPQVADEQQSMLQGPVTLGRNVGLAVNCVVLPGTTIGECSFARPFSVISGSWEANSMIGGSPAKAAGRRFKPSEV